MASSLAHLISRLEDFRNLGSSRHQLDVANFYLRQLAGQEMGDMPAPPSDARLGVFYNYTPVSVDKERVLQEAAERQQLASRLNDPVDMLELKHEHILESLWDNFLKAAKEVGLDTNKIEQQNVSGKDKLGWVKTPDSVEFDLNGQEWRIRDFLAPEVAKLAEVEVQDLTLISDKKIFGDGVVGLVRPQVLGLPEDTVDFYQVRCMVHRSDNLVRRVFKGLLVVHPDAKRNFWAWGDGYGHWDTREGDKLVIWNMFTGSKYNPTCRYTDQGLYYQGVPNWHRARFTIQNLRTGAEPEIYEHKILAADPPLELMGGQVIAMALTSQLMGGIRSGRAKMALPAVLFKYIRGLEHIAELEKGSERFDLNQSFDTSETHGKLLPGFYASQDMASYLLRAAGANSVWTLNRRPDLSTGQCVIDHIFLGVNPFNAVVVSTWSLLLSGLDFDGDFICVFPHSSRGGLYRAFNALSVEEQRARLRVATVNRKGTDDQVYLNGFDRWAGQLFSGVVLGMADINARRFIDAGQPEQAYTLQPWVQASVDRQKRPIPWPDDSGPKAMAKPSKADDAEFATDLLRQAAKGGDVRELETSYLQQWAQFVNKHKLLKEIAHVLRAGQTPKLYCQSKEFRKYLLRWCYELSTIIERIVDMQQTRMFNDPSGTQLQAPIAQVYDAPHRYPEEVPTDEPSEEVKALLEPALLLDKWWPGANNLGRTMPKVRTQLYRMKDHLVDAATKLGVAPELAEHMRTYRMYSFLATPEQLGAYYTRRYPDRTRLSDVLPLRRPNTLAKSAPGVLSNSTPMMVGFERIPAGQLEVRRVPIDREYHKYVCTVPARFVPKLRSPKIHSYRIKVKENEYELNSTHFEDAMIEIAMQLPFGDYHIASLPTATVAPGADLDEFLDTLQEPEPVLAPNTGTALPECEIDFNSVLGLEHEQTGKAEPDAHRFDHVQDAINNLFSV